MCFNFIDNVLNVHLQLGASSQALKSLYSQYPGLVKAAAESITAHAEEKHVLVNVCFHVCIRVRFNLRLG